MQYILDCRLVFDHAAFQLELGQTPLDSQDIGERFSRVSRQGCVEGIRWWG